MAEQYDLTGKIIGLAMKIHRTLGPGFLESVYQKALIHKPTRAGLKVEAEKPIQVRYDGVIVGDFVADLVVNDDVIVEIKAIQSLAVAHEVQLVNYLTATGKDAGLLLNFGAASLQYKMKFRRPMESGEQIPS